MAKKPSKYTEAQIAFFRRTHGNSKGGSLREGDASVLRMIPGVGTCAVNLDKIDGVTGEVLPS